METRTTGRRRLCAGVFAGTLLLVPLAACGDTTEAGDAAASPEVTETEGAPTGETGDPTGTAAPGDASDPTEPGGQPGATGTDTGTEASVDCEGNRCSITLSGDGAEADVLGTSVVLGGVENGRATVRVGNQDVSCGQGESVSAGPLTLACSTVTEDTVVMTASLG